jgi:cell division protein FtsB
VFKRPSRIILSPKQLALLGAIAALVLLGFGYTGRVVANRELQAEVARWEAEVRLEQERLQESQEWLKHVQTDAYVIERARVDLGWTFPDEVAVRMPDLPEEPDPAAPAPAVPVAPAWQQWWDRFFGR